MPNHDSSSSLIIATCTGLVLAGAALFGLLVLSAIGFDVQLGNFFLEGLSWAAFILPAYPWAGALIVAMPGFRYDLLFLLIGSLAPFTTLALTARFLDVPSRGYSLLPGLETYGAALGALLGFGSSLALSAIVYLGARWIARGMQSTGVISEHTARRKEKQSENTALETEPEPRELELSFPDIAPPPFLTSIGAPVHHDPAADTTMEADTGNSTASPGSVHIEDLESLEYLEEDPGGDSGEEPGEKPIPLMFNRTREPETLTELDPALDADYWAADEPRPSLLPKVETFFDGEHDVAVRSADIKDESHSKRPDTGADSLVVHPAVLLPAKRPGRKPAVKYSLPIDGILTAYPDGQYWIIDDKTRLAADVLRETLKEFGIAAEVTGIRKGPVITMFEILPAPGVRLSKIANLCDNIALRLAASSVRIVAPIPGKHAVGIEVPNERRSIVSFREIVENEVFKSTKMEVPVVLGKDITGDVQVVELTQTPHLLIAGATGSGKSVCVNSIILSILYKRSFNEVKLILIDPKIVELKLYNGIPHLLTPVITEPKRAFQALQYCICEMERRYSLLDAMGVRDIKSYNRKIVEKVMATDKLPYIVVVIDEFADLMATTGKELESTLARLAAMSRAVGIHLVLATQRPSIDVITGLIKANIPSRIAFMVASKFDSRIIIDMVGAEKLLGRGDMLYSSATDAFPVRMQGAFVSEDEVERVVAHVKTLGTPDYIDDEIFVDDEDDEGPSLFDEEDDDPLYEKALEIVLSQGKASASFLQRKLKIGYNRAARLVELMEEKGIVGKAQGSKPRDLMHNPEMGRIPNPRARYVPDFTPDEDEAGDTPEKDAELVGEET